MSDIATLYQQINKLCSNILVEISAKNFEQASHYLAERLTLLEQLASRVNEELARDSCEYQHYLSFLEKIAEIDKPQQKELVAFRAKLMHETASLQNAKTAISTYQSVSRK